MKRNFELLYDHRTVIILVRRQERVIRCTETQSYINYERPPLYLPYFAAIHSKTKRKTITGKWAIVENFCRNLDGCIMLSQ